MQTSQITAPATTPRNLLDDVEVWASPITAPPPTLAAVPGEPLCDDCALCQQRLVQGSGRNSSRPLWRWPCRCGMQIHLSCMMHMRIRQCMHCRDPWPGDSADELLQSECHRAGRSIENAWEDSAEWFEPSCLGLSPCPRYQPYGCEHGSKCRRGRSASRTCSTVSSWLCLLPPVLDNDGHIPNLLQDL